MNQQHCFTDALRSAESVQDSQGAAGTENDKVIYTNYKHSVMTPDNDKMAEKKPNYPITTINVSANYRYVKSLHFSLCQVYVSSGSVLNVILS